MIIQRQSRWFRVLSMLLLMPLVISLASPAPVRADRYVLTCEEPAVTSHEPWMEELPKPEETSVTSFEVLIPSVDGVRISARIYLPDAYAGPRPTALQLSPYFSRAYQKELGELGLMDPDRFDACFGSFLLRRGYAMVLADMRGTHNSGGCFNFGGGLDGKDGAAVVDWIAAQSWSNGAVGMWGYSWPGLSQYLTAVEAPAALKAIIPTSATLAYELAHPGGTTSELALVPLTLALSTALPPGTSPRIDPTGRVCDYGEDAEAFGSHDGTLTDYWQERNFPARAGRIKAAVLHATGFPSDNIDAFGLMWRALEQHNVKRKGYVGPWFHGYPPLELWPYIQLRWFEHWLSGNDTGVMEEPAMTLFDQNFAERRTRSWNTGRNLTLVTSSGRLVPKAGPSVSGYKDVPGASRIVNREDGPASVVYITPLLTSERRISGAPSVRLVGSIDGVDTNFAAVLYDLAPDGSHSYISRGYLSAAHRESLSSPTPVLPNVVMTFDLRMDPTEFTVRPGHRIKLVISSSDSWVGEGIEPSGIISSKPPVSVTVYEGSGNTSLVLPLAEMGS